MPPVPFIGQTYTLDAVSVDAQRTINLYPELVQSGAGKSAAYLRGTPGLRRWGTPLPGDGGIRGLWAASNGRLYTVQGSTLYDVTGGSAASLGSLLSSTGIASMADNGLELCVVDGAHGYLYTFATGVFQNIPDGDFLGSDRVAYLDGYFVFAQPGTQRWYISQLLAGGDIDGLDFASAESFPDRLVSFVIDHRELWLFGEQSTEVWFNAGLPDFPFSRIQGAVLEYGCAATHSALSTDTGIYWLGSTERGHGVVYRAEGYTPQRVSTHVVEKAFQSMSRIDDAVAWSYQEHGHDFYLLTFPSARQTWCYDAATQLWHERAYREIDGSLTQHRGLVHAFWEGQHIIGDYDRGLLYAQALNAYADDGAVIPRIRTAPHLFGQELEYFAFHEFQVDIEAGVGLDGGTIPGTTPQVMLQWSNDGGHTWGAEHWVTAGALGNYRQRAIWRRLGRARDRVFRVMITDPVQVALIGGRTLTTQGVA